MAKRAQAGDVFCFYLNEEGLKGYGRVLEYINRIPCIEFYKLLPKVEIYTLEEIKQAPILERILGGVENWEYIGHIPVSSEELPQYYWQWWGGKTHIPTAASYTETNEKLFRLCKRADHLPRRLDHTDSRIVTWAEARLQIKDAVSTNISGILGFIRHMQAEGIIRVEEVEHMANFVKNYYARIGKARAKPQKIDSDKLFVESDQAADVKELFGQSMRKTKDVEKATEVVLSELAEMVEDPDDGPIVYLALAVLQAKKKQIVPDIRARALEIIEKRIGIERWEEAGGDTLKEHLELREAIKKEIEKVK